MFKKILLFSLLAVAYACNEEKKEKEAISTDIVNIPETASGNASNAKLPEMVFEEESHDFGKITHGEKVSYAFKFKNKGESDLVISSAQGSCGCTVPEYPHGAIGTGEDGVINVVFNSEGKSGKVQKTVTIISNAKTNTKILTISAEVILVP